MTDEAQEAPRPQMVAQAAEAMAAHLRDVVGQPNTPQVRQRMREYMAAAWDAADGPVAQVTRATDDAILADIQRQADTIEAQRRPDQLIRGYRTAGGFFGNATTLAGTSDFITSSTSINELKLSASKYVNLSEKDERIMKIREEAAAAFKNLDYPKCHELLGQFLEVVTGEKHGEYRIDGGRLPNYVHLSTLRHMIFNGLSAIKELTEMEKHIASLENSMPEDAFYALKTVIDKTRDSVRSVVYEELGFVTNDGVPSTSVPDSPDSDDIEDPDEEIENLSVMERLIIEQRELLERRNATPRPEIARQGIVNGNAAWQVVNAADTVEPDPPGPQEAEF